MKHKNQKIKHINIDEKTAPNGTKAIHSKDSELLENPRVFACFMSWVLICQYNP